jgi:hypothetical protein
MAVKTAKTEDVLAGVNGQNTRTLLRVIILLLIAGAAVSSRLFSVIRKCFLPMMGECPQYLLCLFCLQSTESPLLLGMSLLLTHPP